MAYPPTTVISTTMTANAMPSLTLSFMPEKFILLSFWACRGQVHLLLHLSPPCEGT
ncbi:hypothetical protein GPEL0_01r3356 [Geoanaerobacter pelophilus]|uniref:Uncharacterized protein n=1 Tax=Geoanaerobacter pelophilus TaxID=60036 RepID=A0ABQ0MMS1_9BACT|nr:hypothetical protein GPEL0_01r3356 [Geoanaerobacter pelophilus]